MIKGLGRRPLSSRVVYLVSLILALVFALFGLPMLGDLYKSFASQEKENGIGGPVITATLDDGLSLMGAPAAPGQVVDYTATIENTGTTDATGVQFSDTLDAVATLVPGSVKVSPVAFDDSYSSLGNTLLEVTLDHAGTASVQNTTVTQPSIIGETTTPKTYRSVLENDIDPDTAKNLLTVALVPASVSVGASVTVYSDGTFEYLPRVGFAGTDTFEYTVTDPDGPASTGVVSITISDLIWYVDKDNAGTSDGRSGSPYTSLAPIDTGGADDAKDGEGDTIFVFDETTGNTGGGILLENNQILHGNGLILSPAGFEYGGGGALVPAGTRPTIEDTAGDVVVLASGNTVRGLDIAATNGRAVFGNGVAGGTFGNVASTGTGSGTGIRLDSTTGTFTITDVDINSSTGAGIDIQGGSGTFTFDSASSIISPAGTAFNINGGTAQVTYSGGITQANAFPAVAISGHSGGTVTFQTGTINATNGTGLQFSNADGAYNFNGTATLNGGDAGIDIFNGSAGTFTFSNTTITNPASMGLNIDNSTAGVTFSGGSGIAKNNAGAAVSVNNHSTGSINIGVDINATNGTGLQFNNADGTYNFNTMTGTTTLNGGDAGIDIIGGSAGTFTFSDTTITNPSGTGLNIDSSTAGVTFGGGGISKNNAGATVNVNNHSTGSVNIGVNINSTNGTGLQFNNADGTYNFNTMTGTTTLNGGDAGIDILSGSAGTFTFGNLSITNPSGIGFREDTSTATVDCSCTISQSNANPAVDINAKTGGGTTFNSLVTANTGSANGIDLTSNTGGTITFSGGLTINTTFGTGFNATGGGTVTVTGTNTIGATTPLSRTAVNITDTTIAGSGVTFQSIAVDQGATSGDTAGIILDDTGAGTFTVTGVNGPCGNTVMALDCDGGTIENITDADAITLNNTDGAVTLQRMLIEDIADSSDSTDVHGTRSGVDGIHGQSVDGGLVLENVTMRRFSDNAVNGAAGDGISLTPFAGVEIRDSLFENSNRYHVGPEAGTGKGDDSAEAMVRINGITGTVILTGSSFNRGAQFLDFQTPTSGALTMTVQNNTFTKTLKEFKCTPGAAPPSVPVHVGKAGISLLVKGSTGVDAYIGDQTNAALGNTFTDNGTASIVILHDSATSGEIDTVISNNDFVILDHLTGPAGCTGGSLQFNHPQGGVYLGPGAGAFEALVSKNLFDQVMHADGGIGQLTIVMDSGGDAEMVVQGNEFKLPWDGGVRIIADANSSAAIKFGGSGAGEANTYTDGTVGSTGDDVGFVTQSPFNPFLVNVRNNGSLDLTLQDEVLHQHDDVFSAFSNSFDASINSSGGTLNLWLDDSKSPDGYNLQQNGGTFNLFNEQNVAGCPISAAQVVDDNGNTGGSNNDNTDPPTVVVSGTITCSTTAVTQPFLSIPLREDEPEQPEAGDEKKTSENSTLTLIDDSLSSLAEQRDRFFRIEGLPEFRYEETPQAGPLLAKGIGAEGHAGLSAESVSLWDVVSSIASMITPTAHAEEGETARSNAPNKAPLGTADVSVGPFTLPAGKTVTIKFQATAPVFNSQPTMSTQGTVTWTNAGNTTTDDPETAAASDATVTKLTLTPSAAGATVTGRAMSKSGRGLENVRVVLTGGDLAAPLYTQTNPFGYFAFKDVEVGRTYLVSVSSKRYEFRYATQLVNVDEDLVVPVFIGER